MTTGAIYGNFKNRDELFIAVAQTYWAPIKPRVKAGATFSDVMLAMAEATIAAIPDRATAAVGRLTGLAYTLTHEELRARVESVTAESYAFGEQWLREVVKQEDLPMPAGQLVRVLHAAHGRIGLSEVIDPGTVARRSNPGGLPGACESSKLKPGLLDAAWPRKAEQHHDILCIVKLVNECDPRES